MVGEHEALVTQDSGRPTRKVTYVGAVGGLVTVGVWGASLAGLEVPAEVATAMTTVLVFGAGYLVRDRA